MIGWRHGAMRREKSRRLQDSVLVTRRTVVLGDDIQSNGGGPRL